MQKTELEVLIVMMLRIYHSHAQALQRIEQALMLYRTEQDYDIKAAALDEIQRCVVSAMQDEETYKCYGDIEMRQRVGKSLDDSVQRLPTLWGQKPCRK